MPVWEYLAKVVSESTVFSKSRQATLRWNLCLTLRVLSIKTQLLMVSVSMVSAGSYESWDGLFTLVPTVHLIHPNLVIRFPRIFLSLSCLCHFILESNSVILLCKIHLCRSSQDGMFKKIRTVQRYCSRSRWRNEYSKLKTVKNNLKDEDMKGGIKESTSTVRGSIFMFEKSCSVL